MMDQGSSGVTPPHGAHAPKSLQRLLNFLNYMVSPKNLKSKCIFRANCGKKVKVPGPKIFIFCRLLTPCLQLVPITALLLALPRSAIGSTRNLPAIL